MQTKTLHVSKSGEAEFQFVEGELLEAYDALALETLAECRTSLSMAARYLNSALWRLPASRVPLTRCLSVGGRMLCYDPENVVERYRENPDELVRDYLHSILHCVFQQVFDIRHEEFDTWALACDIVVELCAIQMCGQRFASALDASRLEVGEQLRAEAGALTAQALYRVLAHGGPGEQLYSSHGLDGADLSRFKELFARDLHDLWAGCPREHEAGQAQGGTEQIPDMQGASGAAQQDAAPLDAAGFAAESDEADEGSVSRGGTGRAAGFADASALDEPDVPDKLDAPGALEDAEMGDALALASDAHDSLSPEDARAQQEWDQVGKRVEAELRAQGSRSGNGEGNLLVNLRASRHKPQDYGEFLRRFATIGEDLRVSDDEFDYIFYTYGMDRYGNVPLVEPLEYAETKRVREFVIALDTSGSCSRELVKRFVQRTYDILRNQTSFGDRLDVHIVQCDKRVRTATKVTSLRQLEHYGDSFWVSGGGGTDFRPVFDYVDSLVEQGEFDDLRGLVYFTDGYGAFPVRPPAYDVAFAFVNREGLDVRVPSWAMKVILE